MNKNVMFALSLILLLVSMSFVCGEEVNSTDDAIISQNYTVTGHSFDDIQKSIDKSKDNDVIKLNGTYTINKKPVTIKKTVTIQKVWLSSAQTMYIFHSETLAFCEKRSGTKLGIPSLSADVFQGSS